VRWENRLYKVVLHGDDCVLCSATRMSNGHWLACLTIDENPYEQQRWFIRKETPEDVMKELSTLIYNYCMKKAAHYSGIVNGLPDIENLTEEEKS